MSDFYWWVIQASWCLVLLILQASLPVCYVHRRRP